MMFRLRHFDPTWSGLVAIVEPLEHFWLVGGKYPCCRELQKVAFIRGWNSKPFRIHNNIAENGLDATFHRESTPVVMPEQIVVVTLTIAPTSIRIWRSILITAGMVLFVLLPTGNISLFLASTIFAILIFFGWTSVSIISFAWKWSWTGLTATLMLVHMLLLSFCLVICGAEGISIWLLLTAAVWNTVAYLFTGVSRTALSESNAMKCHPP